jgi:hypothetical protein
MDPYTAAVMAAAFEAVTEVSKLARVIIESQPMAVRAERATQCWEDEKKFREFVKGIFPGLALPAPGSQPPKAAES